MNHATPRLQLRVRAINARGNQYRAELVDDGAVAWVSVPFDHHDALLALVRELDWGLRLAQERSSSLGSRRAAR